MSPWQKSLGSLRCRLLSDFNVPISWEHLIHWLCEDTVAFPNEIAS